MRRITLSAAIISFVLMGILTVSFGEKAPAQADLSGNYLARGSGVDGREYEATVTLTARGETYLIRWQFTDGEFSGVGIRQGDVLSVGWLNHGKAGVVLYTIHGDNLDGHWADGSTDGKVCTENLVRSR